MKKCWCGNQKLSEYSEDYYKCDECHTLISKKAFKEEIYDVKSEESDLYGKNYWEISMTKAAGKQTLSEVIDMYLTERVVYWLKYVLKYVRLGTSIAEVGCGLGQLQYVLKRLDYRQLAFELSPYICEYMEKSLGIDTHCGTFSDMGEKYDGILAFDLFEHLDEPLSFIDQCKKSLTEDGILCFQTPCYDPELSYSEMRKLKGRFEEQLRSEQHIYLYSKEAITAILKKYGFEYIIFEPAFFGDDYDMFLFASQKPIKENTSEEIDRYLNSVPDGRLIKALIKLFDERNQKEAEREAIDRERNKLLENVNILTELVNEKQKSSDEFKKAADCRLEDIEKLTESNQMLQQAAEERLSDVEKLMAENRILQQAAEERLSDIEKLTAENRILQQAAEERLQIINRLNQENEELSRAARERLDIIEALTKKEE